MEKHQHKEAFHLMNYRCKCGHQEVIWNERDGVTPFTIPCPSCGDGMGMSHFAFFKDVYAPNHKPHFGQRVFCNRTRQRAEALAEEIAQKRMKPGPEQESLMEYLFDDLWRNGTAPDIRIEGYGSRSTNHD